MGIDPLLNPELRKFYTCPFCFYRGALLDFTQTHSRMMLCPECGNEFREDTLHYIQKLNPTKFAEWVWRYPHQAYWKKCKFDIFARRIYTSGISEEFWDAYRIWKGNNPE